MSAAAGEERIALDVHAHLAPVLADRLDANALANWQSEMERELLAVYRAARAALRAD